MKQQYIHYLEWEDFHAGMWGRSDDEESDLVKAIEFTGDAHKYGEAMKQVVNEWPRTMLHNLSNPSMNKRAFLGHCAVCWAIGIPEYIVRRAWKELTEEQRIAADKVAQETVDAWREKFKNI